jgi:hypothetical protein
MGDGGREIEDGRRRTGDGGWETEDGRQGTEDRKKLAGDMIRILLQPAHFL